MTIHVLSCLGVDLELPFLGHFVDHYTGLGIAPARIHLLLNSTDAGSENLRAAEALTAARGLPPPRRWIAAYTSEAMWAERRRLQRAVTRPGDWVINADIDEHHDYPAPPAEIVAFCRRWRVTAVQGVMIDRLGPGGSLPAPAARPSLDAQYPVRADLAVSLFGRRRGRGLGGTVKLMLHEARVLPHRGGHRAEWESHPRYLMGRALAELPGLDDPERRLAYPFRVHHYKWTAGRAAKIERRVATPGASADGCHYGAVTLDYLARHGRIRLADVVTETAPPPGGGAGWKRASFVQRARALLGPASSPTAGRRV